MHDTMDFELYIETYANITHESGRLVLSNLVIVCRVILMYSRTMHSDFVIGKSKVNLLKSLSKLPTWDYFHSTGILKSVLLYFDVAGTITWIEQDPSIPLFRILKDFCIVSTLIKDFSKSFTSMYPTHKKTNQKCKYDYRGHDEGCYC